ncbi:MAG: TCR/Tet family MFS transporter [Elusimicrobia bacterium]|nr:TCR/Tet family MFS transporter [Elusimicrobiota bacterium]
MKRQAGVPFIFATILLDATGLGVIIPVLPDVLRRFSTDPTYVSEHFGWFIGAYAFMQFAASPVLGSLSDRFGRRPILLSSLLGAAVDYQFMAFAPTLPLLFVGRVISGLTGATLTVASSYMADISDHDSRAGNFAMIGAAWGLGFIFGPLLGGVLGTFGPRAPFVASAILNAANFLYGLLVLPESLPPSKRRQVKWKQLNPLASVLRILQPSDFVVFVWIYFLVFLAGQVHPVNWTLYTETKFHWTARQVGVSLSFVGLMMAIAQTQLTKRLVRKLGDRSALTLGLSVYAISFLLFSLASRGWMMYAIVVFFSLAGVTIPAIQSVIGRHTPPDRQGEVQGSLVSLASLASLLAPLVFTKLFVHFTRPDAAVYFPGAAYAGASLICVGALALRLATSALAGD